MDHSLPHKLVLAEKTAIEAIIKGYSQEELTHILIKDYSISEEEAVQCIKNAGKKITETTLVDIDKIIPQHVELYEKIFKEFDDLYYVPGKLKALKGKEKLLGLLKENNSIEIHNEVNIEIEQESPYDINRLNTDEQKRLGELLKRIENK